MTNTSLRLIYDCEQGFDVRRDFQSLENAPRVQRSNSFEGTVPKQNQCRTQTNLEHLYKLRTAVFCKQIFSLVEIYTQ